MPEFDDLYQQVYGGAGGGSGGSTTVETWRQQLGLDALERQHNLPPGLMTSVLRQESGGDPRVRSNVGAQGLFQFMPATAAQYKIDPLDPQQAAPAAARELSSLYRKYGGDVDRTLAAWNWGQGNVDRQGLARMPAETRGFVAKVKRWLSPGVAEAAERPPASSAAGDDLYQQVYGSAPPPAAQQPPGTMPPSPTVSQTTPATTTAPAPSQGPATPSLLERFDALPSVQSWSPADRAARRQEFAALRPEYQEEFLRGEERPAAAPVATSAQAPGTVVATIQPPGTPAALPRPPEDRQARIQQELAQWEQQQGRPWREGDPLMPSQRAGMQPSAAEPPVEESLTAPSTLIPLLMGGAGAKAVQGVLGEALPWAQRLARPVVEGLSQTLGWGTGRTIETGQVPSATELGTEAALNIGVGAVAEVPGAVRDAGRAVLRSTPGGQTILKHQAVQEAEGLGQRVFNAEDKAAVSQVFDDVAATGIKLDVLPVQDLWTSLSAEERRIAQRELRNISPQFAAALDNPHLRGWDIGELQSIRSDLLKASRARQNPATQDILMSMRSAVDDAIGNGMAVGTRAAGAAPEMLQQAQAAWRRVKAAEDLQGLVGKHTRDSANLQWQELNLAALNKELRQGATPAGSKLAQRVVSQMGDPERQALQQELTSLSRHYPFVSVSDRGAKWTEWGTAMAGLGLAATGNLPAAGGAILTALTTAAARSPTVMSLFRRSIIEGQGRLAPHHIDALLNAIRHEQEGVPSGRAQ